MNPAFVVRFRPTGPWRIGPDSGARDRVNRIFPSDRLFSAVTHAMADLGKLDEWIDATVRNGAGSAVRFSSCFPYLDDVQFIAPPRTVWPPPPSPKLRWKGARFVPLALIQRLVSDKLPEENRYVVDGASECLIPAEGRNKPAGPYRRALRSRAAVDRFTGSIEPHATACLEFAEGAGLWGVTAFADDESEKTWSPIVKAAFRLLADTGLGGERSSGWGRSAEPEFTDGRLPDLILKQAPAPAEDAAEGVPEVAPTPSTAHWLLSTFLPAPDDGVDWRSGNYCLLNRGGRVESRNGSGHVKSSIRMVAEGSVVVSDKPPKGFVADVAPQGFPHPVYRAGFAVSIPVPFRTAAS